MGDKTRVAQAVARRQCARALTAAREGHAAAWRDAARAWLAPIADAAERRAYLRLARALAATIELEAATAVLALPIEPLVARADAEVRRPDWRDGRPLLRPEGIEATARASHAHAGWSTSAGLPLAARADLTAALAGAVGAALAAAARAPEVATAEAGPAPEAPDPLPALLAALQRDGVAARAEHRAAIAGSARLPARIVAAARAGDAIALGPIGAGKTGAALEVVRAEALEEFGGNVPQVGNGRVSVERFRITIEKVDEPPEVIHERIRKLWRTTSNHHHYDPLKHAAAKFGLDLDSKEFGADVPGGM